MSDAINPNYYNNHPSGVKCSTITRWFNFNLGNVIKYVWRAGHKPGNAAIQDLEKARWYISDEIARLQAMEQQDGEHH